MSNSGSVLPTTGVGDPGGGNSPDPTCQQDARISPKSKEGDRCRMPRPPVPGEEIGSGWNPRGNPDPVWDTNCSSILHHDHFFHGNYYLLLF